MGGITRVTPAGYLVVGQHLIKVCLICMAEVFNLLLMATPVRSFATINQNVLQHSQQMQ